LCPNIGFEEYGTSQQVAFLWIRHAYSSGVTDKMVVLPPIIFKKGPAMTCTGPL